MLLEMDSAVYILWAQQEKAFNVIVTSLDLSTCNYYLNENNSDFGLWFLD